MKKIAQLQTVREDLLNQFNYKKTNAFKGVWSCTGYGGKCASCKRGSYGGERKYHKEFYFAGDEIRFSIRKGV